MCLKIKDPNTLKKSAAGDTHSLGGVVGERGGSMGFWGEVVWEGDFGGKKFSTFPHGWI